MKKIFSYSLAWVWALWFSPGFTSLSSVRAGTELGTPFFEAGDLVEASAVTPLVIKGTPTELYSHGDPSAMEQLFLELINRARANPEAEADRYGIDLNEGLEPGTISSASKPPLAFALSLTRAAREHSLWLLEYDEFTHTGAGGSSAVERMTAAGYPFGGAWQAGENLVVRWTQGSFDVAQFVRDQHASLMRSAGHRANIMHAPFREVGIGLVLGDYTVDGEEMDASMATHDFAWSSSSPESAPNSSFLLGVVFDDVNGDGLYTPGEGIANMKVTPDSGSFYAVTSPSGGYALPLPAGVDKFQVVLSGAGWSSQTVTVTGGDVNVKRDFIVTLAPVPEDLSLVLSDGQVAVPEGGSAVLSVGLSAPPLEELGVTVTRLSGDKDIACLSPTIVFTPDDYMKKEVVFRADEDLDTDDGTALFRLEKSYGINPLASVDIVVTEVDDDIELTIISDGPGSTEPSGLLVVDLDAMPVAVTATPGAEAAFLGWSSSAGSTSRSDSLSLTLSTSVNTTVTAYFAEYDSDGDGMADEWEIMQFGDLSHTGTEDTDGDGISDLAEFLGGLDPWVADVDTYVIVLYPGWNAVGVPSSAEPLTLDDIFSGYIQGPIWQWDAQAGRYVEAKGPPSATAAYWVYAPELRGIVLQ